MKMPTFSRRTALAALTAGTAGLLGTRFAQAQITLSTEPKAQQRQLLCVFLRGAADGLNIVVPHGSAEYYALRPSIAVPEPGKPGGALDLNGHFGLHPRLAPLKAAYDAHQLALITAVGSPHPTRSHFEAQDYMETGAVGVQSVQEGWLSRYLALHAQPAGAAAEMRAVALSARTPLALRGYADTVSVRSLKQFKLTVPGPLRSTLEQAFVKAYAEGDAPATRAGRHALEVSARLRNVVRGDYSPENGAIYQKEAEPFADVARLIKADVGLETAWIDLGGWDTHKQEGASDKGELPKHLDQLGRALAAFRADLGPRFENVLVVVMSEFGRTAHENGTGGTDHGHGNVMLVLGGRVKGGHVYGKFPGLAAEHLYEGRDVPVTTDYRDVLAEITRKHLGLADSSALGTLFPGYTLDRKRELGLLG
jgi:uncharacterized protein (DUF1501 family)